MSEPRVQKLSFFEKAGYSLGDGAANFVFQTMILFQLNFYTDTMGIVAAVAGSLLLVGRLWDAFFDPMMGLMADRTNTRWGKFRPWVLWTALPWGVVMVVAYTTPNFSGAGKIVYACVTNIMLMTLYSANNTPYSAMTGRDDRRRQRAHQPVVVPLRLGDDRAIDGGRIHPAAGGEIRAWRQCQRLADDHGPVGVDLRGALPDYFSHHEGTHSTRPETEIRRQKDFSTLLKTGPWVAMFILTLAHFSVLAMRGGTLSYYFQYYVNHDKLFGLLQSVGLVNPSGHGLWSYLLNTFGLVVDPKQTNVASVGFSLFNMSSQFVTVIGVLCSTYLSMKFGKKAVAIAGFSLTTIFMALFALIPADAVGSIFLLEYVRALSYAPTIPLIWSMYADVVDYSEWKTGRRITGVIYATILFGLKFGLSLGGAMAGWLLSGFGYRANAVQTAESLTGIRLTISLFPTVLFAVVILCLMTYKIGRKLNIQIQDELAERRKGFAPAG
jgi:glycoside/pentoside/hexuronide:cation symporter, GPH family